MDLFDVIGPVMIGPSSSHTAGAARIGKITRMLLGCEPRRARIGLHGSFQKTYLGHGTDKALVGGLLGMDVDDLRLRSSLELAKARGLEYSFYNANLRGAHPNTVVLDVDGQDGRSICVQAASVGGGEIVVQSIDGLEAGFSGHENTLVLTHHDTPGMIAAIGGTVAGSALNIATMRVFRRSAGGEAMVALELDGDASQELLRRLEALEGVYHVAYIAARKEV
ncbi:MAG TPA: L-serine ammonia-lyase, iron-sulfur-dependent, subunit beta [Candidatus Limiplasma stercoravium]|nr:L-serine ammonia-lyase, iron-sulfur-dependent, subunit beta [Candidatus Limiplasma stercoravium]